MQFPLVEDPLIQLLVLVFCENMICKVLAKQVLI